MARQEIPGTKTAWSVIRGMLNNMFIELYQLISNIPTVPTKTSDLTNDSLFQNASSVTQSIADAITALKASVPSQGDNLKKLYDLVISSFSEVAVADSAAKTALNITKLPTNVFVSDDGDGKWALYKATSTGTNANYEKLSDPDLLNAVMSASQIKSSYESNANTNAFTDNDKSALTFVKDTPISYTASIPFTKALTDIATHTMVANITLTANSSDAVDNACTQLLLVNNTSYSADVTAFHAIGEQDNTKAYSLLTFERKRGLYLVSIVNFD